MTTPDWIAVDWGNTALRAWLMRADGSVIEARRAQRGVSGLTPAAFERAFLGLVGDALTDGETVPVLCCGAVGSREGWAEAPYAAVPCRPPGLARAAAVDVADSRISVRILPGLRQDDPAETLRGEETQIAGFLRRSPGYDGVLCLAGTHTKWAHVSAGEVVSFRSFMTGELFALLSQASILRHSLDPAGWDEAAFLDAVGRTLSRPQGFAAALLSIRAEGLLGGLPGAVATARLSGLLIGLELAGARPHWLGQQVRVIGDAAMARPYRDALAAQGVPAETEPAEDLALDGLRAAWESDR